MGGTGHKWGRDQRLRGSRDEGGRNRKWGNSRGLRGSGVRIAEEGFQAAVRGINGLVKVVETLTEGDQVELAVFNGVL